MFKNIGCCKCIDTNEIKRICEEVDVCPYHFSIYVANKVDLLLCPYNYLLGNQVRNKTKINIEGKVLVFDEAHNMENFAEDANSLKINKATWKSVLCNMKNQNRDTKLKTILG